MKLSTKLAAVLPATALAVSCVAAVPAAAATLEPEPPQQIVTNGESIQIINELGTKYINEKRALHQFTQPLVNESDLVDDANWVTQFNIGPNCSMKRALDPGVIAYAVPRAGSTPTLDRAIDHWHDQRANYDYLTGGPATDGAKYEDFRQMMWKSSTKVGLSYGYCTDGTGEDRTMIVAAFGPPAPETGADVGLPISAPPVKPFNICNRTHYWLTWVPEDRTLRSGGMIDPAAPCDSGASHWVRPGLNHTATYKYDVFGIGAEDPTNPVKKVGELTITMKWDMDGNSSYTFTKSEGLENLKVVQRGSDLMVENM